MNKIKLFENAEFGNVRIVEINGEPWIVGKDVAEILGYSNPLKAIRDHVDEEDKTVNDSFTVNGTKGILINESGFYSLVLSSKMPRAKEFKHWVTSEVLPTIRKTGGYIPVDAGMSDMEVLARAVLISQRTIEQNKEKIRSLEHDVDRMKPKEIFADAVTASKTAILIRDFAKILKQNGVETGEKRLYRWLRENGYVIKGSTQPTQKAMELGLFEVIESTIQRADKSPMTTMTTKITGKGQIYFANKFLAKEEEA